MLRMVPSENIRHGICRFIRPGILLLLLVLPVNAGTRLEGRDKELTGRKNIWYDQNTKSDRSRKQQSAKAGNKEQITNHQISPWNKVQVFK